MFDIARYYAMAEDVDLLVLWLWRCSVLPVLANADM
jgi:hypothetical protein